MAEINASDLSKKLKAGELCNLYYIYGKDIVTVEAASKSVMKKHLGKSWDADVTRLDGRDLNVGETVELLEMNPMFADFNAVWINDLNAEELSADRLDMLINAVQNIPEYTVLLINITGFDVKNGKKFITGKNKKLVDCFAKNGVVCECAVKTLPILAKEISERAQKNGCTISRTAAEKLAQYCLLDSMLIKNELLKLCAYRENDEIRSEDIDLLVSGQIETDAFKLARAVVMQDSKQAFVILSELLSKRDDPLAVLPAVSMSFLDLYRARAAQSSGKQTQDVVNDFSYKGREFAVNNAFRDCRKISVEGLRKCMAILRDTDRKLKQTSTDTKVIMEKMLTEILIAARR